MTLSNPPWVVFSLLGLTVAWLCLVAYFLHYIRRNHWSEFEALGQPSIQQGSANVVLYIFRRRHRALHDRRLSLLCDAMLACLAAVAILLVYAVVTSSRLAGI